MRPWAQTRGITANPSEPLSWNELGFELRGKPASRYHVDTLLLSIILRLTMCPRFGVHYNSNVLYLSLRDAKLSEEVPESMRTPKLS